MTIRLCNRIITVKSQELYCEFFVNGQGNHTCLYLTVTLPVGLCQLVSNSAHDILQINSENDINFSNTVIFTYLLPKC